MNSESDLLSLFLRLAPIDGVSHAERKIADEVIRILRAGGIRVIEDGSAAAVGGNAGNLLCFPPAFDQNAPTILLEAHLDTVQSTSQLKAIVKCDRVTSDRTTILGADNRMGLSMLVHLLLPTRHGGSMRAGGSICTPESNTRISSWRLLCVKKPGSMGPRR